MSLSDFGKVCLFSGMSGVITLNGNPVVNARLVRTADRNGSKTDETTTDDYGYFEFPAMWERTITKYLPQEFVASQKIVVFYEGIEYEIWSAVKRKPEENIEVRGNALEVKCELNDVNKLTDKEKLIVVNRSHIFTVCKWDVEQDPPYDGGLFDDDLE